MSATAMLTTAAASTLGEMPANLTLATWKRLAAPGPYAPKAGSPVAAFLANTQGNTESPERPPVKAAAYRAPVVQTPEGSFRKVRANGTTRSIPTYPAGTALRETAEAMASAKAQGASVATVAATFHVSVASVRRMLASLALTIANEA